MTDRDADARGAEHPPAPRPGTRRGAAPVGAAPREAFGERLDQPVKTGGVGGATGVWIETGSDCCRLTLEVSTSV